MKLIKKSSALNAAVSILVFHTAFILPGFANAGTSTTATSSAGGAPIVVNLTAAQEATMATSLAGWGSFNAFAPIVAPPAPAATSKTSAAAPAVTVTLPPAAAAAAAKVASPAFQASLTAAVNSSMANFNPTTYAAANPDSKQMDLINLLNSGQYAQAFTYAKANGMDLLEDLETASGLESLMSPSSSLNPFPLPVTLNPFSKTQMEAYYAAAAAAIGNGTLPSSPVQGSCMEGTVDAGCAVQDTQTQSNYIWVTPTASEADKNAAASTLPNLLGYSAIGQPPPKDSAGLDIAVGVILGVMTAGVGAVVGSAIAAGVGVASSAVTTAIGSAIVAGAVNGVTSVAEGGSFLSGLESGLIGGALGGAVALSGVTSDISSGLVDSGVNSTVAQDVAGFAVNTATGTALNGGNIGAAALGAGEGTAENAGLGILQGTPTNSNTDMGIAASNAATAAYAAGNFPGIDLPPGTIANSEADTTYAIASSGLQASGISLDGTSDVTGQDSELEPIQTTATKLPVGVTAPGSVDPLSPVDVTANKTLPAGGFAAVIGSTGADGSATSGGELSSNVSSLIGTASVAGAAGLTFPKLLDPLDGYVDAGATAPAAEMATGNGANIIPADYDPLTAPSLGEEAIDNLGKSGWQLYQADATGKSGTLVPFTSDNLDVGQTFTLVLDKDGNVAAGLDFVGFNGTAGSHIPLFQTVGGTDGLGGGGAGDYIGGSGVVNSDGTISISGKYMANYTTEEQKLASANMFAQSASDATGVPVQITTGRLSAGNFTDFGAPATGPVADAAVDTSSVLSSVTPAAVDPVVGVATNTAIDGAADSLALRLASGTISLGGKVLSGVGDLALGTSAFQTYVDTGTADLPAALQAQSAITASMTDPNASTTSKLIAAIGATDDPISPNYDGGTYGTGLRVGSDTVATALNGTPLYRGAVAVNDFVSGVATNVANFFWNGAQAEAAADMAMAGYVTDDPPTVAPAPAPTTNYPTRPRRTPGGTFILD